MSPIDPVLSALSTEVAELTAGLGRRVDVAALQATSRTGHLALAEPGGLVSPNGACRLVRAADGWIAVNLAREEDRDLIPAWLGGDFGEEAWAAVAARVPRATVADLMEAAVLLGLPVARVGEARAANLKAPRLARGRPGAPKGRPRVVDLSALWAGPLCGAILAAMGGEVVKVESLRRPDPTRASTPEFFRRLNGAKADLSLDLGSPDGQARLADMIAGADVLITGVRPRGLASLGLSEAAIFAANPDLVWVAVTGHGWTGPGAARVGFGDDAAAAGGLLGRAADGTPRFLGDALSDPVTGLAAAVGALRGLAAGGGVLVDASLSHCAAGTARALDLPAAA